MDSTYIGRRLPFGEDGGTFCSVCGQRIDHGGCHDAYEARIKELEEALRDALEGFEDGSNYKGDYLREKHGDPEEIARLRALLPKENDK